MTNELTVLREGARMKNKAAREPLDLLIQTRVRWFQQKRAPHHGVGAIESGPRSRGHGVEVMESGSQSGGHGVGATELGSRSRSHGVGATESGPRSWGHGVEVTESGSRSCGHGVEVTELGSRSWGSQSWATKLGCWDRSEKLTPTRQVSAAEPNQHTTPRFQEILKIKENITET